MRARESNIDLDSISVTRGGRRWFPVMGEYHFDRDSPRRWLHELRKIRAGGVDVVSTYLFWNIHEEIRGSRQWDAHCDVRAFVEAAQQAGLVVMLRIGPWVHGESRNGGFPDWLQELPIRHRTDDPEYLALVEGWYGDIAQQLAGLFRDAEHPDAPIIGIQVDNELYDQPDHLATLRDMAEAAGMTAPIWVATGWGGAQLPLDRLAPVYAGYPDAFWEASDIDWPDWGPMHFRFSDVRDDLSVGADLRGDDTVGLGHDDRRYPFLTCELGGGMSVAYHRRPRVDPDDVAALALTKIGSGSAWQGYYLYHGTTQVTGELSGLQESHESGYPNDMPVKEYDYSSPIGPSGKLRRHYHLLRRQHLFLEEWGGALTELPPVYQSDQEVRWVLRSDGQRGYIVVNNHQPAVAALPARPDVQFSLDEPAVTIPSSPALVGSGVYFVWPLRQAYGDIDALSGTVQPLTQVQTDEGLVVVFAATRGIDVELEIESSAAVSGAVSFETPHGLRWRPTSPAGPDAIVTVGTTRLIILDDERANDLWRVHVGDEQFVILWDGGVAVEDGRIVLERWEESGAVLSIPPVSESQRTVGPWGEVALGGWTPPRALTAIERRAADGVAPRRTGGPLGRLSAPTDLDFDSAATFEIDVPTPPAAGSTTLTIEWRGDVARAYIGEVLVSDQFWFGRPWEIDLALWADELAQHPLRIEILPWNGVSEYYLDARVRPQRIPALAEVVSALLQTPERVELRPAE